MSHLIPAISKNGKILAIFAVSCTAIVGLVQLLTKERIAIQAQQELVSQLNEIIVAERHNNEMYNDCLRVSADDSHHNEQLIYRARLNEQPVAAAIKTVAPDGYNGNIALLIAINLDGSVSGVRTLEHKETPGLGDKIELRKSDWITSFNGKRVHSDTDPRWAVNKDGGMFDQFTGATITPRAVVKVVRKTVDYFNAHQQMIFNSASNCDIKS